MLRSIVISFVLSCLASRSGSAQPTQTFPLESSTATHAHPAIAEYTRPLPKNHLSQCTATLIGKRLVLTAAHCVDNTEGLGLGQVQFTDAKGKVIGSRDVATYYRHRHDGQVGPGDFAVLVLEATACNLAVAPLPLAKKYPVDDTQIRIYGFGCTKRPAKCPKDPKETLLGGGDKQLVDGKLGATKFLCPGDSGGPVIAYGAIVAVNSGYSCVTKADIFAPTIVGDVKEVLSIKLAELSAKYTCKANPKCPEGTRWCECTKSCGRDGAWCKRQQDLGHCTRE